MHAEGDLAKWSARDIHDIAGHHLPGVDLVVMVVNQVTVMIVRGCDGDCLGFRRSGRVLSDFLAAALGWLATSGGKSWLVSIVDLGMTGIDGWYGWYC